MLKARYKDRKRLANELGGDAPLEYIFPNTNGTAAIWNIRKRLKSIYKFADINKTISMHDFRRTLLMYVDLKLKKELSFQKD